MFKYYQLMWPIYLKVLYMSTQNFRSSLERIKSGKLEIKIKGESYCAKAEGFQISFSLGVIWNEKIKMKSITQIENQFESIIYIDICFVFMSVAEFQ
jgi:hypothetical protein